MAGFGLGSYPSGAFSSLGSSGSSWGSLFSGGSSGGGFWSGVVSGLGSLFGGGSGGGGSSGGSNMWGNIFQGILGGLGGMASGGGDEGLTVEQRIGLIKEQSHEQRRNIGFAADMEDFTKQRNKIRQRAALDTYGQFSLLGRYAPNYKDTPAIDPGVRPSA